MEPRSIERGETAVRLDELNRRSNGFNGATFNRTWRARPVRVRRSRRRRFNGATFNRTWRGACRSRCSPCTVIRFNGATFNRTWRVTMSGGNDAPTDASMEPRSIERGEMGNALTVAIRTPPLQWSHVQSNVESTGRMTQRHRAPPSASMEPRSIERGEPIAAAASPRHCRFNGATFNRTWRGDDRSSAALGRGCFNGATFNRTWRGQLEDKQMTRLQELQWSHVQSNVERRRRPRAARRRFALQWSHVQSNVERHVCRRRPNCQGGASMEPRSIERGE